MKTFKELEKRVVQRLRYCWGENAAIFFINAGGAAAIITAWFMAADIIRASGAAEMTRERIGLANGLILTAAVIAALLMWGLAEPFLYGVKWYRIQQIRGNSVHARSIFSCYDSWKRTIQVYRLSAALLARRLVFIIPLAAVLTAGAFLLGRAGEGGGIAYSMEAASIFLLAGCIVCAGAVFNCKYALVPYLFALEPDTPPKELIKKSIEITKGRRSYIAEAVLSAAVWLIPCILIFPAVFAVPYIQMVYTAAVNEIIEDGEKISGEARGEIMAEEYAGY